MATHSSILAWRISWTVCIVYGFTESDMTRDLHFLSFTLFRELKALIKPKTNMNFPEFRSYTINKVMGESQRITIKTDTGIVAFLEL